MTIPDAQQEIEAAAQRIRELTEQVVAQAKENGLVWLEGYEKMLKNLLDLQEQAAQGAGAEWVSSLATAQANFVRQTSEVFFSAVSKQLKS